MKKSWAVLEKGAQKASLLSYFRASEILKSHLSKKYLQKISSLYIII